MEFINNNQIIPAQTELNVYVDGACTNNGTPAAVAGIGIWVEQLTNYSMSEPVPEYYNQTNQVAELLAIQYALHIGKNINSLYIYTDSQYAYQCINTWCDKWRVNNWKKADGTEPANVEIIKAIRQDIDSKRKQGSTIWLVKVKAHSTNYGNNMADKLAQEGVKKGKTESTKRVMSMLTKIADATDNVEQSTSDDMPISSNSVDNMIDTIDASIQTMHVRPLSTKSSSTTSDQKPIEDLSTLIERLTYVEKEITTIKEQLMRMRDTK